MFSKIGIGLWIILSMIGYVIAEGLIRGNWHDRDVKGVWSLLKAMFSWIPKRIWQILILFGQTIGQTIRFLVRLLKSSSPRIGKWCWGNSKKIARGTWKGLSRATRTIKKPSWVKMKKIGWVIKLVGVIIVGVFFFGFFGKTVVEVIPWVWVIPGGLAGFALYLGISTVIAYLSKPPPLPASPPPQTTGAGQTATTSGKTTVKSPTTVERIKKFWQSWQTWLAGVILGVMLRVGWPEAWAFLTGPVIILGIVLFIVLYASHEKSRGTATMIITLACLAIMVKVALPSTITTAIKNKIEMVIEGRWPSPPAYGTSRSTAERSAATPTSRVTTQTIVAKPGVYSKAVSIPPNQWFRTRPQSGCVEVKTATGKIHKNCPGEINHLGEDVSLLDSVFSFRSLEEREVEVIVEWEPK